MDPLTNVLIYAAVEILKRVTRMPTGFAPLVAVVCGVALSVSAALMAGTWPPDEAIATGVINGLMTCGAYDLVMKIIGGLQTSLETDE